MDIKILGVMMLALLVGSGAYCHSLNITDYDTNTSEASLGSLSFFYGDFTDYDKKGDPSMNSHINEVEFYYSKFFDSLNQSYDYSLLLDDLGETDSPDFGVSLNRMDARYNCKYYFDVKNSFYQGIGLRYASTKLNLYSYDLTEDLSSATISFAIGAGHIVDITPLADAGVMEDRLTEAGILKGPLSKEDMLKIADIIRRYDMDEYDYKQPDTARGRALKDISDVLMSSGQVNGSLSGFAYWRINQSSAANYDRYKGSILELSFNNESAAGYFDMPGNKMTDSIQGCTGTISYLAYLPMDWRSQLKMEVSLTLGLTPLDQWKIYISNVYIPLLYDNLYNANLSYTYDLTNSVWFAAEASYYQAKGTFLGSGVFEEEIKYRLELNLKAEDRWLTTLSADTVIYYDGTSDERLSIAQRFLF